MTATVKKEGEKNVREEVVRKMVLYSQHLSALAKDLYRVAGLSQTSFAAAMGMTQPGMSVVLSGERTWSLELVIAMALWQQVSIEEIFAMVSERIEGRDAVLWRRLLGTVPGSSERLTRIIRLAYGPAEPDLADSWLSADVFAAINQQFFERYAAGEVSDERMLQILRRAQELSAERDGGNWFLCVKDVLLE